MEPSQLSRHEGADGHSAATYASRRLQSAENSTKYLLRGLGTQYLLNGDDVISLQSSIGHSRVENTMLYGEMSDRLTVQHRKFPTLRRMELR